MSKHSRILVIFLAFALVFVFAGLAQQQEEETVVCPVSGKQIKKSEAKATLEHEGKTYYFCCEKCKEEFVKNPEKYTQKKAETTIYTCPMHPEVQADKPGKCPKCGMDLEKKKVAAGCPHAKMHKHEHMKMKKKSCCAMMGLMESGKVEVSVENVEEGIVVKVTSKDAEVVKKIQEKAAKMKEKCAEKEEVKE